MGRQPGACLVMPAASEVRWTASTSTHSLATGEMTSGAFALVEERAAHGVGAPLHRHTI